MQRNAIQLLFVSILLSWMLLACNSSKNNVNTSGSINSASAPQNVIATADIKQITISWDVVDGATTYKIYWSLVPNITKASGTPIDNAQSPYVHANLNVGAQYYYVIVAIDESGEGLPSVEVTATAKGEVLPTTFSDNNLNNCFQSLAVLNSWQYTEDVTGVLDCSYRGITSMSGLQQFTQLEGINLSNNNISDLLSFQLLASLKTVNLSNNNFGKQTPVVIDSLIALSGLTSLYLAGNRQLDCISLDSLVSALGSVVMDVSSVQSGANCTSYTEGSGNIPGTPSLKSWPTEVEAVPGNKKVTLNWNDAIGANSYRIYWSDQAGVTPASGNLLDNVTTGYVQNGLSNFSNYYYIVTAMINGVESEPSVEVFAQPSNQGIALSGLFTDANLQACIDELAAPKGWTFAHELTVAVDCSSKGITYLSGLENLTALRKLNLSNNSISDIASIQALASLQQLLLNNNSVVDVFALNSLDSLIILNLRNNSITDIAGLNSVNTLAELYLSNNQIVSVANIALHTNIITLDIRNNAIGGEGVGQVDRLAQLKRAKKIRISGNTNIACSELQSVLDALGPNIIDIAQNTNLINCSGIPTAPLNIRVIPGDQKNIISWSGVIGAQSYNIYWANTSGVSLVTGTKIAAVFPGYTHNGLSNETAYYYIITAENASGESPPSVEVFANPQRVLITGLFNDRNFQLCVDELATLNGWTTAEQITGLLNCSYQNIKDIAGIEKLQGLTRLSLNTNSIYDISPLSALGGLKTLSLYDNTIQDISIVASLVNLTDVFLSGNDVSNVQAVANLPNLNTLDLRENRIGSTSVGHVDSLANLTNATEIQLQNNLTMSCPELARLLANTPVGVLDITTTEPGINCSDPALVPSNVTVVAGDGQVTLNWDKIDGISGFFVYWATSPGIVTATTTKIPVSGNRYVHNNLLNSNSYYYVVTSKVGNGESGSSDEVVAIPSSLGVSLVGLFPDVNLAACVSGVTTPNNWTFSHEVTGSLNCSSNSVSDLTGIGYLTSLKVLRLGSNQISDITSLSTLSGLEFLDLYNNLVGDISPIGSMVSLQTLYLHNNNISNAGALANLSALQYLILDGNTIMDSSPIANISSLTDLYYRNNGVTAIAGFSQLTQLTTLYLNNNQISDVSSVGGMALLKEVDLRNNIVGGAGVGKIDSMSSLANVSQIWLSGNANLSCSELSILVDALGPAAVDIGAPQPGVNCLAP